MVQDLSANNKQEDEKSRQDRYVEKYAQRPKIPGIGRVHSSTAGVSSKKKHMILSPVQSIAER